MLNRDYYAQFSKEEAEAKEDKSFDQRYKERSQSEFKPKSSNSKCSAFSID